jgi:hypothetical protein
MLSKVNIFLLDPSLDRLYQDLASNREENRGKKSSDTVPLKSGKIISSGVFY